MAFRITQTDESPSIVSTLSDGGVPVDITGYNEVSFHLENEFKEVVINDDTSGGVNVIDASTGLVEYVFSGTQTDTAGVYHGQWKVEYSNGKPERFPTGERVEVIIGERVA